MKANQEIRNYMEKHHITMWQLGAKLGRSDNTMIRRLRMELPEQEKAAVLAALAEIVKEREA
jgi:hypothetical protein